jgi:hypothetical protein
VPDPVARFLGPGAVRHGPFGVLGLPVREVGEAEVLDAVHAAMARIDRHPEARTPAADEARLAVHASAANLLDDAVRTELLRRLVSERVRAEAEAPPPPGPARAPRPTSVGSLEADLIRCIASAGGWNARAMQHYLKIAHLRGHRTNEAMLAIRGLLPAAQVTIAAPPALAPGPARSPTPTTAATPSGDPTARAVGLSAGAAVGLVCLVIALAGLGAWIAVRTLDSGSSAPGPETPGLSASSTPPPRRADPPMPDRDDAGLPAARPLDSGPAVLHELTVAVDGLAVDLETSASAFERATAALAARWTGFSPADLAACHDQIVAYIYRVAGQRALAERALGALERGASGLYERENATGEALREATWSVGMLVRLRREQNLPGTIVRRVDTALLRIPGGIAPNTQTFQAGAVAALRAFAGRLANSGAGVEPWRVWVEATRAATPGDGLLAESMIVGAAEAALRARPDAGGATAEGAAFLVSSMSWRPESPARAWLLRAFEDRSLRTADLHLITLALGTRSGAEGVDPSMVLPASASEYARRELRERYRALWGLDASADQGVALDAFAAAASATLAEPPRADGVDDPERLAAVVRVARLNASASLLWRAETPSAIDLLNSIADPVDAVLNSKNTPDFSGLFASHMSTWAESYLGAEAQIPRRLELLDALSQRRDRLGPMEAEVLAAEALRGSPQRVRDAAASVLEQHAAQPTVVNAVLELLPVLPRTDRNARLVEVVAGAALPRFDAPDWPAEARRALVEKLLEVIAGHGHYAKLDAISLLLDEAYDLAARGPGASDASPPPAVVSASGLVEQWRGVAANRPPSGLPGLTLDEIERRRRARLAMASGLIQQFHVEQLAVAELMALVVAAEQPDRASRVSAMLDAHTVERGRSGSVLLQIAHTERLILALWMLRFGEEAA